MDLVLVCVRVVRVIDVRRGDRLRVYSRPNDHRLRDEDVQPMIRVWNAAVLHLASEPTEAALLAVRPLPHRHVRRVRFLKWGAHNG
jgi:hypothetical protein